MEIKAISRLLSVFLWALLLTSNATAAFVDLPTAPRTSGCGKASWPLIRCGGAANNDPLYIDSGPQIGIDTYAFPTTLSLINQIDTNFQTGSGSTYYSGTFSDYAFWDTTTNSVVIGSRLYFGLRPDGQPNIAEANDIFRYGYDGFKVQAAWTRLSDSDLRLYSVASSNKGLGQGADVYDSNVVDFRSDVNSSEGNPISGLYLIRTDATAFKVITNAIEIRQGGEEGQPVLSVKLAGYAPTKLNNGVAAGETVKLFGGTYASNMNVRGNVDVQYGNATFNGNVVLANSSQLNVVSGSKAIFNGAFNQQVGSQLNGGGTFEFNGGYSPGNSPGAVVVTGNVVFGALNEALFEIAGLLKGDEYDHLTVDGDLYFGGTLKLVFLSGFKAKAGDTFDLFDWTTAKGTFSSISTQNALLDSGLKWNFDNLYTNGTISVEALPVPEPENYAMILSGLMLVSVVARRKYKN